MIRLIKTLVAIISASVVAAVVLGGPPAVAAGGKARSAVAVKGGCWPVHELHFVCGAEQPEDMVRVPGSDWVIISEFRPNGGIKLLNAKTRQLRRWNFIESSAVQRKGAENCPGPPNPVTLDTQGLSLRTIGKGRFRLYVVNHGGRESIEIFSVTLRDGYPLGRWQGCVLMPPGDAANAVSSFPDGAIIATVLTLPGRTKADFVRGQPTGAVLEWKPGMLDFHILPGTELPGNNGLVASPDGRRFYVVAFGLHAIYEYRRADTLYPVRSATAPGFMPDNIHWFGNRLIAAGMTYDEPACGGVRKIVRGRADPMLCHRGYVVATVSPNTLRFRVLAYGEPNPMFNGATTGLVIGTRLWISSYQADRLAYRRLPGTGSGSWVARTDDQLR